MSFFKKYKLHFDILAFLVFALATWMFLDEYLEGHKKIKLVIGIASGLMAVIRLIDLIGNLRKEKNNA